MKKLHYLHNGENRRCFHTKNGIHVEALPDGNVRVFKAAPFSSMYYSHDKGFHQPETEIAMWDSETWQSVVGFVVDVRAALTGAA